MTQIHRYLDGAYHIGFVENWDLEQPEKTYSNTKWLNTSTYRGGWFADPFIISADDNYITLLVEEFRYDTGKGRLSKIQVQRDGYKLLKVEPILDISTHLSYPHPISQNGELFICPENCAANEVSIYKFDGNNLYDKIKILDGRYVDTQIIEHDGTFYAFTTITEKNGGSSTLEIFNAPKLTGPYTHSQTINNPENEERGAGPIFKYKDRLIRPTQNCRGGVWTRYCFSTTYNIQQHFCAQRIYPHRHQPQIQIRPVLPHIFTSWRHRGRRWI